MLTPHWLDKVVGDLILGGPAAPAQVVILHLDRVVGDLDTRPAALPTHLPTSCTLGESEGTAHTLPGASTPEKLKHPAFCTIEWSEDS